MAAWQSPKLLIEVQILADLLIWALGLHRVVTCLANRKSGGSITHKVHLAPKSLARWAES